MNTCSRNTYTDTHIYIYIIYLYMYVYSDSQLQFIGVCVYINYGTKKMISSHGKSNCIAGDALLFDYFHIGKCKENHTYSQMRASNPFFGSMQKKHDCIFRGSEQVGRPNGEQISKNLGQIPTMEVG